MQSVRDKKIQIELRKRHLNKNGAVSHKDKDGHEYEIRNPEFVIYKNKKLAALGWHSETGKRAAKILPDS